MPVRERKKPAAPATRPEPRPPRIGPFLERHSRNLAIALVLLASVRIVATYTVFSQTSDEAAHLACGMEWLDQKVYQYEPQHPPLARVAAAMGPYLLGSRSQGTPHDNEFSMHREGNAILAAGNQYTRTLAAARAGILPFFWMACLVVYWWGRSYFGAHVALAAVFFVSLLPPVLAHAGLATTDMALTAFLGAAFLTGVIWVEAPTARNAALFGLCGGLAIFSKFSSLVYFPDAAVIALAWYYATERPSWQALARGTRERLPTAGLALLVAFFLVWTGYRFSFGPSGFHGLRLPAPELFEGIREVARHNREGHPTYLLGQRSSTGFWYFYPVALAVKTPLAFLALLGLGLPLTFRRSGIFTRPWLPLAFVAGIMAVAFESHINIGIRHILPVYLSFSLIAAVAVVQWLERSAQQKWRAAVIAVLLLWFTASSLAVHPDYLGYFNELAGSEPEKILVDSDLDWGQDMKRLGIRLHELGAQSVSFFPFVIADYESQLGIPKLQQSADVLHPAPGWNAISITAWKVRRFGLYNKYTQYPLWPDYSQPLERIGKGILLYYFPPGVNR